ncbi:tolloid-like protein 1 [Trichonephila inaurata madagascariensis]|uniref:Tolloid-like protein 1 n=1 Tax=Trichonephila inaurata madagascariensis TaxID=2747483 RepID=A0A8X6XHU0_9ARAC|nr:tolloid-like protein 1 [Trichonephila inaurata madagascariensis]
MWDRRTVLAAPLLLLLVLRTVIARSDNVSGNSALAWTWFPHLISKDTDMDPSKAEIFEGDIIIDRSPHRNFSSVHSLRRSSNSRRRK